ncbi:uncharacterized protein N7477_002164 [Penicillium maclennaniae]|uniref:uncharacterized protein n=1 Tax=Penicillium maclennaniae TaxID=1343394 RepID=UPI002541A35B|nr:uncharacterized protein N7477_002164 [Penicillium maclennaniae]KAJ5676531.1 hypothetical protein N7477_002164 [Penicillium maclennaniae]
MPADQVNSVEMDNELYESAEDEDFQLDGAEDDSDLSDSDNETVEPAKKKRKTDKKAEILDEELDSGDEITIRKARDKRRKRKGKKGKDDEDDLDLDDDEGGAGGFVRTRAMKAQIQEEQRKPLAKIDGATIDVDSLWEQMNAPESQMGLTPSQPQAQAQQEITPAPEPAKTSTEDPRPPKPHDNARHGQYEQQMIKIKRTYKFAGEMITEEKTVPKDSAEAKVFLSSGENVELTEVDGIPSRNLRRPLRKISRFDPNPTGTIKKNWEKQVVEADKDASGPKINTVEKSRLDWAQYVDEAGIKDELRTASKAKEGYIGRMDFLGRVDAKRDEEARQARLKGM